MKAMSKLAETPATPDYRQRMKGRFQQEVADILAKYSLTELVIVLDSVSAFLLSNIFSITELVAMKILFIQRLEVNRKKLDKHALYFMTPSKTNIDALIADFPVLGSQQTPQYRRIHILFTSFADKSLLKMLAVQKGLLKRIAKHSVKQFYFSTRVLAPNLLDMNLPYLGLAFSKPSDEETTRREAISKKMIEFVASFDSINTVRIYYKKAPNKVCENVALTLESTVKNYLSILLENRSQNLSKSAQDITFLLLDRSVDTVTPFIHYFTYESLLFDFFTISMVAKSDLKDKGAYSYEQIQGPIYEQYRYQHLSEALSKLPEALENQKGRLESLKNSGHETVSIKQLAQRITDIKSNIQKLQAVWKQFQAQKMQDMADLEQSIATGITSNAENTSSVKLISDVVQLLKNATISRQQKLRLGILCLSCIKTSREDYQTLLQNYNETDKKILKNLIALGVSYDGSLTKSTKTITKDQQKIAQKRMESTGMHLNRYTSIVELVVPLFCKILSDPLHSQTIDKDVFGQILCTVFKGEQDVKFSHSRFAMAMIGGLSWSEVSAIRNMPQLSSIVLMGDSIMTVNDFLGEMSKINILGQ